MADRHLEIVRIALALHLRTDPERIDPLHRLDEDLGLDPLDLVLVVLQLEEVEQAELPVEDLAAVTTVAGLAHIVRRWAKDRRPTLSGGPSVVAQDFLSLPSQLP